jgi:hypothetical protein
MQIFRICQLNLGTSKDSQCHFFVRNRRLRQYHRDQTKLGPANSESAKIKTRGVSLNYLDMFSLLFELDSAIVKLKLKRKHRPPEGETVLSGGERSRKIQPLRPSKIIS